MSLFYYYLRPLSPSLILIWMAAASYLSTVLGIYPVHLRNHFPTLIHFILSKLMVSASKHHSSIIINCLYLQTLFRHSQLYTYICTCMACPALLSLSYHYAMLCYTCQSINLRINPSVHHHQFWDVYPSTSQIRPTNLTLALIFFVILIMCMAGMCIMWSQNQPTNQASRQAMQTLNHHFTAYRSQHYINLWSFQICGHPCSVYQFN